MPLPEKKHFTLGEIAKRWNTPYKDLAYYIEDGTMEAQTWLDGVRVEIFFYEETSDGESFSCPCGYKYHKGYAIISASDCRKIFKHKNGIGLSDFKALKDDMYMRLAENQEDVVITAADLRITKEERDRLEKEHKLQDSYVCEESVPFKPFPKKIATKTSPASFPGRPSIMSAIKIEFKRRAVKHHALDTLHKECAYLASWANKKFQGVQVPKQCSIENALRTEYRVHYNAALSNLQEVHSVL